MSGRDPETAGQSHQAMFECGPIRGKGAAKEKCATNGDFLGGYGLGLGSSVGRARPW